MGFKGGGGRFVPVVGCVKWAVQYALVAHKSKLRFGDCSNLLVTSAKQKQQWRTFRRSGNSNSSLIYKTRTVSIESFTKHTYKNMYMTESVCMCVCVTKGVKSF